MIMEAETLKDCQNPFIIKFIDAFRDEDDNAYLVTEYADGFDL